MKTCKNCGKEARIIYLDYAMPTAPRPYVVIRDAKIYKCDTCGEESLSIISLSGFNAEVLKLPIDNEELTYFALDYMGTWFRMATKEY